MLESFFKLSELLYSASVSLPNSMLRCILPPEFFDFLGYKWRMIVLDFQDYITYINVYVCFLSKSGQQKVRLVF